jgi:hypothetical protein
MNRHYLPAANAEDYKSRPSGFGPQWPLFSFRNRGLSEASLFNAHTVAALK